MDLFGLSHASIAALAAMICYAIAVLMFVLTGRQRVGNVDQRPSVMKAVFSGESLTAKGANFRIVAFIAMMFAIMNTLATAFIYIAAQMPAPG